MIIQDNELTIRPILESETGMVLEVYRECEDFLALGPQPKASLTMVKQDLNHSKEENEIFCGIFDNRNRMLGIVDFVPQRFDQKPEGAFLALLMIAKPHRGHGIGDRVVKLIESEIVKNKAIRYIYSGVQVNNEPAIGFWGKMGYEIYGGPELLPDQTTVYHLKKRV
jgi:ribosomal protein S18 acetylase RimI-like enzyme